mmetsp:Transcript_34010/g.80730  ORF Transcript_34010/g.80730 Transcript_34010/m.80730 type:complete len:278 (-) Transcript_34010:1012-1845(-)
MLQPSFRRLTGRGHQARPTRVQERPWPSRVTQFTPRRPPAAASPPAGPLSQAAAQDTGPCPSGDPPAELLEPIAPPASDRRPGGVVLPPCCPAEIRELGSPQLSQGARPCAPRFSPCFASRRAAQGFHPRPRRYHRLPGASVMRVAAVLATRLGERGPEVLTGSGPAAGALGREPSGPPPCLLPTAALGSSSSASAAAFRARRCWLSASAAPRALPGAAGSEVACRGSARSSLRAGSSTAWRQLVLRLALPARLDGPISAGRPPDKPKLLDWGSVSS